MVDLRSNQPILFIYIFIKYNNLLKYSYNSSKKPAIYGGLSLIY